MTPRASLSLAVIFVRDLDASVRFYTGVLGLEVADRSATAVLLSGAGDSPLVLRAIGEHAERALGSVGVQYVVWAAASEQELGRVEEALRKLSAHRERRAGDGYQVVEGRDPDGVPVLVCYPGPDRLPLHEVPARVYGW